MGAFVCCYFSYLCYHLCYLLHSLFFVITPIASYTTSYIQMLSIHPLQLAPHFSSITIIISRRHTFHCQPRRIHCDHRQPISNLYRIPSPLTSTTTLPYSVFVSVVFPLILVSSTAAHTLQM